MKIVRKFNDFVKNRINEDVDPIETPNEESPELEDGIKATENAEEKDQSNLVDDQDEFDEDDFEEGEEESGEYEGNRLMSELAEMLGTEVVNNEIEYEGHKINFFSETDSFHIDKNKKKFGTPDEVVDYLKSSESENNRKADIEADEMDEDEKYKQMALESRRFKRKR